MADMTHEEVKPLPSEQAAFILGTILPRLGQSLTWLSKPGRYNPRIPQMIREGDLPIELLHPYQGILHQYPRKKRKQILIDLHETRSCVARLNSPTSRPHLEVKRIDVETIEKLFEQLYQIEEENFTENQKGLPDDYKADFENRRTSLEHNTIKTAKQFRNGLAKILKLLLPQDREAFKWGRQLATAARRVEIKLENERRPESAELLKTITVIENVIARASKYWPQLSALIPVTWDGSRKGIKIVTLTSIEQIKTILRQEYQELEDEQHCGHSYPHEGNTDEPDDPDGWEELTKQQIKLFGKDIHLQPQHRLVLLRLLFSESVWQTAGDINVVKSSWREGTGKNQLISAAISKTEKELAHQLNIKYERIPSNSLDRPIQRRAAKGKEVEYRIDLKILEQLIRKIR